MQQTELDLGLSTKRTRKREFLAQMEQVVPWAELVDLVLPYAPPQKTGRRPFEIQTMLRIHFMQQWFTLSDPAMEEALHDVPLFREFARLTMGRRLPDETAILRFRHLLEKHKLGDQILATVNDLLQRKGLLLKTGTVVDATLIAAPSSTKNKTGQRDLEMHQTKKGNQWYFGMTSPKGVGQRAALVREADAGVSPHKAHIGVDVHSVSFIPCVVRQPTLTTLSRATACCTGRRLKSSPTPTIRAPTSGPTRPSLWSGTWP